MKVIVTGGSGLVGKAIQEIIEESDLKNKSDLKNNSDTKNENTYKFFNSKDCNLTNYDKVYDLFAHGPFSTKFWNSKL